MFRSAESQSPFTAIALAAAIGTTAACSYAPSDLPRVTITVTETVTSAHDQPPRCYDQPLPAGAAAAVAPAMEPLKLDLLHSDTTSHISQDPIYNKKLIDHALQNVVEVKHDDWKGTGFITSKEGRQVVVTAAHVIGGAALRDIKIMLPDGKYVKPLGGCYILEDKGKFVDFRQVESNKSLIPDHDVAVLDLPAKTVNTSPLKIAESPAQRGDWDYFVNCQGWHNATNPAIYTGIVASAVANKSSVIITGLEQLDSSTSDETIGQTNVIPGASGGPVLNASGNVIGISTSASRLHIGMSSAYNYLHPDKLATVYNISIPGAAYGPESRRLPEVAYAMPLTTLQAALHSPRS